MLDFLGDVVGSVIGANAQKKATNAMMQNAALDRALQKEFAQNSIQWKMLDAKRAGVHPLAALGNVATAYSPVSLNLGDGGASYLQDAFSSLGRLGQNLTRARTATQSPKERSAEVSRAQQHAGFMEKAANTLELEHMSLRNDLLRSEIARLNSAQVGPAAPTENFPPGSVDRVPARNVVPGHDTLGREAGRIMDYGFSMNDGGGLVPVPGQDIHERIEDNWFQQMFWAWRNNLAPAASGLTPPSPRDQPFPTRLPDGRVVNLSPDDYRWEWDPRRQAFYPQHFRSGRWAY